MTLIDLIKVLSPDTPILVRYRLLDLFTGDADESMNNLSCETLERTVENIWLSKNVYKAIVIELE